MRKASGTRADLRLLRTHKAVLVQLVAVVVVAFAVYALVMALLDRTGDFAMWVWIPILASGILIGVVLDLAHRRVDRTAAGDAMPVADRSADH